MARTLYTGITTPSASVTVYWAGTTVKPSIYVSAAGATASNPITAAAFDGKYSFWVDDGKYDILNGNSSGTITVYIAESPVDRPMASDIRIYKAYGLAATDLQSWLEAFILAPTVIGNVTAAAGSFTTLAASSTSTFTGNATFSADHIQSSANGATMTFFQLSEEITLSTSGATTDSTANLLPANSIILGVVAKVTTAITTATDWKLGDPTTAARFAAANSTMTTAGKSIGYLQMFGAISTDVTGPQQVAAAKVRITTTGTPGAGKIRVTVFGYTLVAPTT